MLSESGGFSVGFLHPACTVIGVVSPPFEWRSTVVKKEELPNQSSLLVPIVLKTPKEHTARL